MGLSGSIGDSISVAPAPVRDLGNLVVNHPANDVSPDVGAQAAHDRAPVAKDCDQIPVT